MNILVIGGAGYIGSHTVLELCELGYKVTVFDNLSTGYEKNIDLRADFYNGSVLNIDELNNVFKKKYDAVFHFASLKAAGQSMIDPNSYSALNIAGSINIINKLIEYKIQNFIFSSSAAVYGSPNYLPIDEAHQLDPVNYYGYTKLVIENTLHWYSSLKNIKYGILRYFNAAGYDINGRISCIEKKPANLLPLIMEVANGNNDSLRIFGNNYDTHDGTGIRDYIHVNDIASAHEKTLSYIMDKNKNITVNLGSNKGYSVLDIIKNVQNILGRKIKYSVVNRRKGDIAELVSKSKLANDYLGWECKYSDIENILKTMWNIYRI